MDKELKEGAEELGIKLSDLMVERFKIYHKELLLWNKKMNLVSRGDEKILVRRHFLDSLDAVQFIPKNAHVLDIGSGAGFPGVPIKIVRDDIELDLLEPRLKKFNFLNHLAEVLNLCIKIYRQRIEEFKLNVGANRRSPLLYDVILSRSVGKLKWLNKVADPVLGKGGRIITYKGLRFWDEFKEVSGWEIEHRKPRKFCAGTIVVLKRE